MGYRVEQHTIEIKLKSGGIEYVPFLVVALGSDNALTTTMNLSSILTLEPDSLVLAEVEGDADNLALTDDTGHVYTQVKKHDQWLSHLGTAGYFCLQIHTDDQGFRFFRNLIVSFPFGSVLAGSKPAQIPLALVDRISPQEIAVETAAAHKAVTEALAEKGSDSHMVN